MIESAKAAALPEALLRVPRTATQPPAARLLSYGQVMERLGQLSESERVRIEILGRSRSGRSIPVAIITSPDGIAKLAEVQATAANLAAAELLHRSVEAPIVVRPLLTSPPKDLRLPILFLSSNYGMEAAQVEALVELSEALATDRSEATSAALEHLVVLIVPMINPDGYEIALDDWSRQPLSPAMRAEGNFFGVQVTREYLHLIEPETRALARLVRQWHPFLVWEVHEDGIGLGWDNPEVCLCPPISPPGHLGIDVPAAPGENDPRLYREHQRYGDAIARAWAAKGYNYLHDAGGRHGWPRFPVRGYDDLIGQPETRFTRAMPLRGVTAFITESCRVPGSQTWEDRIGQKVVAGRAIVETAAQSVDALIQIVSDISQRGVARDSGSPGFFLIPTDQDPFVLGRAIEVLLGHGVLVYRATEAIAGSALVVPAAQPLRATVELLLSLEKGKHQSLVAALGLRVRPSSSLTEAQRSEWANARLTPVIEVESLLGRDRSPARRMLHAVDNTHDGVRLVNRLLELPGTEVRWNVAGANSSGGFVFRVPGDPLNGAELEHGLRITLREASEADFEESVPVRQPRIGLYAGQGVRRVSYEGYLGRLRWLLAAWKFPYALIRAENLKPDQLAGFDVLIVPNGSAREIVEGPDREYIWHRYPWELDDPPAPMAEESMDAIRSWVAEGGSYVGIDAGGGLLATRDFLGLMDATRVAWNLGTGLVELRLENAQDSLFDGIRGSWSGDGKWQEGVIYALYASNPGVGEDGGCVFDVGEGASNLATYVRPLPVAGVPHLRPSEQFNVNGANGAIVGSPYGSGFVTAFGIEPTYRCQYLATARLISNAIFKSALSNAAGNRPQPNAS